jgi:AP2-associated kinase
MYQSAFSPPQPYGSPSSSNPYRASPVAVTSKQPYTSALSPPPSVYPSSRSYQQSPIYQPPRHTNPSVPAQPSQLPPARHKGTLAPGQIVKVGDNAVKIERYLSEGGYAHVYLTSSERPIYPPVKGDGEAQDKWGKRGYTEHCLKRIAFQDESVWADVKKEIAVMVSSKAIVPPSNRRSTLYAG